VRPRWLRLVLESGEYNPRVRKLALERSGAYAVRERDSHRVMYVGESSCGKLWKTMLRHFQAPESFAKVRERGVFRRGAQHYEVAIWPTSKGNRRCTRQGPGKNEPGDQKALDAQAQWIERLRPELNADDGLAEDDSFDFGANVRDDDEHAFAGLVNPGTPRVVVDAPPERRAENRTPDLFTGRTRLDDKSGKGRRDWKGEAERLARELAECKRAPVVVVATSAPAEPSRRPEGYGETDERGQARMFRRNPKKKTAEAKSPRAAMWEALWTDAEYLRLQATKDAALKEWSRLSAYALEQPRHWGEQAKVADERAKAALRDLQAYEEDFERKWTARSNPGRRPRSERGRGVADAREMIDRDAFTPKDARSWLASHAELVSRGTRRGDTDYWRAFVDVMTEHAKPRDGWWDKQQNPRGSLTNLGALTELVGRDLRTKRVRVMRWPVTKAPTLAYDKDGRLFIVYGARVERPTTAKESAEYRRTHWGRRGRGVLTSGGVAVAPFRRVMAGESITYTTEKGTDSGPVDYVHAWGEGARGKWLPPIVVEHECHPETCRRGAKCAAKGAIALMGGTYKVNDRGIVG
jgi:hypothetical protein